MCTHGLRACDFVLFLIPLVFIIGDEGVGKRSLGLRFLSPHILSGPYIPTSLSQEHNHKEIILDGHIIDATFKT